MYDLVEKTGFLKEGSSGYDSAKDLWGRIYEIEANSGENLLLIAVSGYEVSNDHFPYYEFLFSIANHGEKPRLLSLTHFYYDCCGIEGLEWWWLTPAFWILGLILTVPATSVALLVRWRHQQKSRSSDRQPQET